MTTANGGDAVHKGDIVRRNYGYAGNGIVVETDSRHALVLWYQSRRKSRILIKRLVVVDASEREVLK